tara:strand:- start:9849 stop:10133 length:285 start_codon:yes stop_codon:yes gene_type:complete
MSDTKQKYVKLKQYNEVIIFPTIIDHSEFIDWEVVSAGFCHVHADKIVCFGKSISLGIESKPNQDTFHATKQVFGWEEAKQFFKASEKEKEDGE